MVIAQQPPSTEQTVQTRAMPEGLGDRRSTIRDQITSAEWEKIELSEEGDERRAPAQGARSEPASRITQS